MKRSIGPRSMNLENLETRALMSSVRIMPLGDSITSSFGGHASYRFFLYNQLLQAGYDVDFVGSQTLNNGQAPLYSNFDKDNEGHSGWRADEVAANTVAWATANNPDIVLLHVGTNDIGQGQSNDSTAADIGTIIDNLRSVNPNVKILLAQIIPTTGGNVGQYSLLNGLIATLATQKNTAQSPVILVDQFTGFNASTDTFDGNHPNDSGERKMSAKWFAALASVLPAPTPQAVQYLSNLTPTSQSNGWGPFENDRSNNETGATDGHTLNLGGVGYLKGLGVHAASDITYNISGGSYTQFNADIGVDEEVGNAGSVVFQVYVDGNLQYTSPTLTGSSATVPISIPLNGASTLRLVVTNGGNGNTSDHADWANARLTIGQVVPPPIAPTGLAASYNSGTGKVDLSWSDNAGDETGYRIERKTGTGGTYSQIADLPAGSNTYSDNASLVGGTTYYYRVYAYKTGAANSGYSNEPFATVPIPPGTYYLSDLSFVGTPVNGWGPLSRDKSNGEQGATDGKTITLNGVTYSKGLGVHANSDITFALNGQYTEFDSDIGIDDEVGNNGNVIFQVYVDGVLKYTSPTALTGPGATQQVVVPLTAANNTLRLVVNTNGDSDYDHADWANARLIAGVPTPPPNAPTNFTATLNDHVDLTWQDNSDETSFRIERKTGINGVWATLQSVNADQEGAADASTLLPNTTYYYRVIAVKNGLDSIPSNEAFITTPQASQVYVSDLTFTSSTNGWGPISRDKSNGEQGATDGKTITINGQTYAKGLGVHANSDIIINLVGGNYTQFLSDVGLDDEVGTRGSAVFRVYLDGSTTPAFDSGVMSNSSPVQQVNLSLGGISTLRLSVTDGGNGNDSDHADWANAQLLAGALQPVPDAPTNLQANVSGGTVNLTWTDKSSNEIGFRVDRKQGAGGNWGQIASLGANATSYPDATATPGVDYYYRVYAYNSGGPSAFSGEVPATVPVPAQSTVYLSDVSFSGTPVNGWGPVSRDKSNGEQGATDGKTITLNGVTYTKGLGVHADSDVRFALNGLYTEFDSDIGVDDEVGNAGNVIFQVYVDDILKFASTPMTGASATQQVSVPVVGANTLRLVVLANGANTSDHADWASARVIINNAPNNAPSTPVYTEPNFDGKVLNPADVHMEAPNFSDPDGDSHFSSDWEIRLASTNELIWHADNKSGVEKVHIHLGDGVFSGSYAGRTELVPDTDYIMRCRYRDSRNAVSDWGVRLFSTGDRQAITPLYIDDALDAPAPTWVLASNNSAVDLPVGTSLLMGSAGGETLLQISGSSAAGNTVSNPSALTGHVNTRLVLTATSAALNLGQTNLTFTEGTGDQHIIYLPAVNLAIGQSAYFWVGLDGSTYVATSSQTTPNTDTPARVAPIPFTASQSGYVVEQVAGGLQLPTDIAFVPNPGSNPTDVLFYVTELYGTIKAVQRDGAVVNYATNLLNFNPTGAFPGSGEQGVTGIVVDPTTGDVFASMVYSSQPGVEAVPHYPKVVRFHSTDGGHTAATQTIILNMAGETMGQSHIVSNLSIGPDGKLYVHVGDGFDASKGQDLNSFRGKILRVNFDGTAPTDNPFYNAGDGINAKDYVYAYGFRNPFGGAWRDADGKHYEVENGPSNDRLAQVVAGRNYLYNGSDASMNNFAIYNWNPAHAPVNLAFIQNSAFNGSGFPASKLDHLFVTESGPTYATGPQSLGKRIVEFTLDANGNRTSGPTNFVTYSGSGKGTIVGLAAGPDGLYFTELYKDQNATSGIDVGARIFRVKYVGP
ncbi:MAG TPA: NPCBM/NEW2 domain-containing protein [Tepidisphaeraceae bacterium]|nr:NPCBM/NEW2 domain-containing protein [Tepidisphaeraceae bacterium]